MRKPMKMTPFLIKLQKKKEKEMAIKELDNNNIKNK